jgi:hypothetical protein
LLRPGAVRDAVALTSPTTQIRRSESTFRSALPPETPVERRNPMKSSGIVVRTPPPPRLAVADSMTRIGVPAPRRRAR